MVLVLVYVWLIDFFIAIDQAKLLNLHVSKIVKTISFISPDVDKFWDPHIIKQVKHTTSASSGVEVIHSYFWGNLVILSNNSLLYFLSLHIIDMN